LSFNWIENTLSDTGIRFLCRWIIRCRDESEGFDCKNNSKCSNCGQPHMASSKYCQHFIREKEIQKIKSEKIFHTLRRADSSLQRIIHLHKNRMPVSVDFLKLCCLHYFLLLKKLKF
jgi:hypothetical protein